MRPDRLFRPLAAAIFNRQSRARLASGTGRIIIDALPCAGSTTASEALHG